MSGSERTAQGLKRGADGRREPGAGLGAGGLDAEHDDASGAIGQILGQLADGSGMGAEIAALDGRGIELAEGSRGQAHVGGVEQDEEVGMQAADEAGEILGGGGGVDAAPIRMPEGAGEDGPEAVVAVAGIADAEEEVHGGGGVKNGM